MKQNPDFCPAHPDDPRCGGMRDGGNGGDGMFDAPDASPSCIGSGAFVVCPTGASGPKTLSGTFDTGTANAMCSTTQLWQGSGQTASCFVVGTTVTVQNVTVTGNRPLVIVATADINVTGQLDVASHIATATEGPGSLNPGTCGTYGNVAVVTAAAGGGAGASLVAAGGSGGNGGGGDANANAGGTGYAPFLATPPGTLRAGCRGQNGGTGQGAGGVGGFGGGAVYLAAGAHITLGAAAILNASGAGGGAAGKSGGGGGGGSGGMIVLWAGQDIAATTGAIVVANGGGGSTGGTGGGGGGAGVIGNDPDPTSPLTPAPGATGAGGPGGKGFALGMQATGGINGATGEGGGGGGGGGGYIQSNKALTNAKVSPAANVVP
ncbi:MAG TPA: hypothetical protein VIV40_19300 [Kofleriaceae bacterium]